MTTLLTSLHFLTFKNDLVMKDTDIGCLQIYEKNNAEQKGPYSSQKQKFIKSRNSKFKQTQKIKENIKDVEELLLNHKCLSLKWNVDEPLLLFLNNGAIMSIKLDKEKCNIERIGIDRYLCGKLISDHLVDVVLDERCLLISYSEPKLTYICLNKLPSFSSKLLGNKRAKFSAFDPKFTHVDLIGPCGRRLERKLSLNTLKDCVLIWWRSTNDEVWPWTPVNYSIDRINMLVYTLSGLSVDFLCSTKVNGDLINASFSKCHSNHVLTLEENKKENALSVNICIYEIARGRCHCVSLLTVPIQGHLVSFDWSPREDKLFMACDDQSLLIFDVYCHVTLATKIHFMVKEIVWHPENSVAMVLGTRGQLNCYDASLSPINLEIISEGTPTALEIIPFFHQQISIQKMIWQNDGFSRKDLINKSSEVDTLLLLLETGPLVFVKFSLGCLTKHLLTSLELISQYLKCGRIDDSICLLQSLNWGQQSELCYKGLSKILNFLLRKPLTSKIETALEVALGTFYNSCDTFPEALIYEYQDQVGQLARRFFHHLLRYHRFEKAFLLAVDLDCRDLFLDLHHVAKQKGETALAVVAFQKAEELNNSESSCTEESVDYDDQVTDSSDSTSEGCDTFRNDYHEQNSFVPVKNYSKYEYFSPLQNHPKQSIYSDSATLLCNSHDNIFQCKSVASIMETEHSHIRSTLCTNAKSLKMNVNCSSHSFGNPEHNSYSTAKYFPETSLVENKIMKSDDRVNQKTHLHILSHFLPNRDLSHPKHNLSESHFVQNTSDTLSLHRAHEIMDKDGATENDEKVGSQNEYFEDEDDDVEGSRIKFVHFGVV